MRVVIFNAYDVLSEWLYLSVCSDECCRCTSHVRANNANACSWNVYFAV